MLMLNYQTNARSGALVRFNPAVQSTRPPASPHPGCPPSHCPAESRRLNVTSTGPSVDEPLPENPSAGGSAHAELVTLRVAQHNGTAPHVIGLPGEAGACLHQLLDI